MSKIIFSSLAILAIIAGSLVIAQQGSFPLPPAPPSTSSFASELPDREIDDRVRLFFSNLTGVSSTAFEDLLKGGPLSSALDATKLSEIKLQFETIKQQLGTYRSNERIDSKFVGKDVIVTRYLYKGDHAPMVWYFTFYRSSSTSAWFVISLRFDTNIEYVAATINNN